MKTTTQRRLEQIDLYQLESLTVATRAILANAYRRRGLPVPAWLADVIQPQSRLSQ